jgi:hypothetical protein
VQLQQSLVLSCLHLVLSLDDLERCHHILR